MHRRMAHSRWSNPALASPQTGARSSTTAGFPFKEKIDLDREKCGDLIEPALNSDEAWQEGMVRLQCAWCLNYVP